MIEYVKYYYGLEEWYDYKGRLYRENGAASKWADGNKEYYIHGVRHRLDGPAFIWGKSHEYWVNGQLHCTTGPALYHSPKRAIGMPARTEYWVRGKQLTYEEWKNNGYH